MSDSEQLIELLPASLYTAEQRREDAAVVVCALTSERLFILHAFNRQKIHYFPGNTICSIQDDLPLEFSMTVYTEHPTKSDETNWFTLAYRKERAVAAARLMFLGSVLAITDSWGDIASMEANAEHFVREGLDIPYLFKGH